MENQKTELRRTFTGKVGNFVDKQERKYENMNLKNYLKGSGRVRIGFDEMRNPIYEKVHEKWIEVNN